MDEALYDAHFAREDNDDGNGISMTPTGSSKSVTNRDHENDNTNKPYVRKPPSRKVMIAQTAVHFLYTIFNIYFFIILWYLLAYSYRENSGTLINFRGWLIASLVLETVFRLLLVYVLWRCFSRKFAAINSLGMFFGGADYFYQLLMADVSKIVSPYYRFLFLYHLLYLIYTLIAGIAIWFGNSNAAAGAKEATVRNIYLSCIVIWGFMTFKPFVVIGFAVLTWIL